jgi:hypothetical protein
MHEDGNPPTASRGRKEGHLFMRENDRGDRFAAADSQNLQDAPVPNESFGETAESDVNPSGAATPTRVCPKCAALSHTAGEFCPYCGARFAASRGPRLSKRVKVVAVSVLALFVLGGAGVAVAIKAHHDNQVAAQHRMAVAAARAHAQAAARAKAAAKAQHQAQQAVEISTRHAAEVQLQDAITKDATSKANQGLLTSGPAQSTTCTPTSGGSSQNLSQSSGTYSCIAVDHTNSDGTQSGYRYTGTINFSTGEMTWQLGGIGG